MKIKNILNYLPLYPHYKMNVFSGTNTFSEIKDLLNYRLKGDNDNKQYEKIISQTLKFLETFWVRRVWYLLQLMAEK